MLLQIKKILNRFGYDVKRSHPFYETVVKPLGIRTVIDIGANTGHYASESRGRFPEAMIYSFEPLKDCFQEAVNRMNGDARFKAFNIALGDKKGETVIQKSSFHPSSSLLRMADLHKRLYPKSEGSTSETIAIDRLDDILDATTLEGEVLVKIDVQGFEDKVIAGGKKTLERAAIAVIETSYVPLYEGQPLFDDIYRAMTALGFAYYGDAGRHYSKDTDKLIYEDSVFVKRAKIVV